jgi:UDP:flavonoid glycosyltransferase YjiC (YdhE family)
VDVVLGDIPPLAFAAAARAGLASIAVTNFGWDWIYSVWPGFDDIVRLIQNAYAEADVLLRLPLSARSPEAFQAFERIEDVPLIARRAHRPRESVRAALGFSSEARVVLVSFGAFTARGLDLQALGRCTGYAFVVTPPLAVNNLPGNVVALNETPSDYVSLLAACDVVITKPGYGIVADCLANRVAVLFTDRGPFREYDVLADALPRLGRARYIPRSDLFGGDLSEHLEALFASRAPWTDMPMNGADVVASRALSIVSNLKR